MSAANRVQREKSSYAAVAFEEIRKVDTARGKSVVPLREKAPIVDQRRSLAAFGALHRSPLSSARRSSSNER